VNEPPSFDQWRAEGQYFHHRGQPVFYAEHGAAEHGDTLLCIHGFPTASWDWHRIWPVLRKRFAHVLAPDLIGYGWSSKPRDWRYSAFDHADLVQNLLAERGVRRCYLLAHDYGDTVAQEILARDVEQHGHKVLPDPSYLEDLEPISKGPAIPLPPLVSLCMLNGGLFPESHRARTVQKLLLTAFGPALAQMTSERSLTSSIAAVFGANTQPGAEALRQFWALVAHESGQHLAHKLIRYIPERQANRERWVGALQSSRMPIRFINGLDDPVSGGHMAERYRQLIPQPDVVELPGIGHFPQLEAPLAVAEAFLAFVGHADVTVGT
jgi:pimeloyl-ACP methyl ester carboxylesterase